LANLTIIDYFLLETFLCCWQHKTIHQPISFVCAIFPELSKNLFAESDRHILLGPRCPAGVANFLIRPGGYATFRVTANKPLELRKTPTRWQTGC
jgi:hypothetical protein